MRMHADEVDITVATARRLLDEQFPTLGRRPLEVVQPWGTDHAIWRLGDDLVVRFPRIHWAAEQPDREAAFLPQLAGTLPVAIPEPVAVGQPGFGFPYRWAIHRWVAGEPAGPATIADHDRFALDLAAVVHALRAQTVVSAPEARGRARPLSSFDEETRRAIEGSRSLLDAHAATAVWESALAAPPATESVWVHGDLDGNCLVAAGRLSGLIDWGSACCGDPAADVHVVWSELFTSSSRTLFLDALEIDAAAVDRSRGMALSQACLALPYYRDTYPLIVERSVRTLHSLGVEVL